MEVLKTWAILRQLKSDWAVEAALKSHIAILDHRPPDQKSEQAVWGLFHTDTTGSSLENFF